MNKMPFCSIIIPALNEEEHLPSCLASLNAQSYPRDRFEIIVVDNGSSDDTHNIARRLSDHVFLKPDVNVGGVRNFGAEKSKGDILIFTDADCLFHPRWLEDGALNIKSEPDTVFGGGIISGDDSNWIQKYWTLNTTERSVQQRSLMGSCIFITKSNFLLAGRFPEDITSGEDTELSEKCMKSGLKVKISPKLSIIHMGTPKNLTDFIKRQAWHGENYFKDIKKSTRDLVFWTILAFIISCFIFSLAAVLTKNLLWLIFPLIFPMVLSAKRIYRSRDPRNIANIHKIFFLDLLYIVGRVKGIIKSISA